jgi:hypothetical protein
MHTPEYTRGGMRFLGGVSIPCRPVTSNISLISISNKQNNLYQNQGVKNGLTMEGITSHNI